MKYFIRFLFIALLCSLSNKAICKETFIKSDSKWIVYQTDKDDYLDIYPINIECHLLTNNGNTKIDIGTRPDRDYSHVWNFTVFSEIIPDKYGEIIDVTFDNKSKLEKTSLSKMHFAGIQRNNIIRFSATDNQIDLIIKEINKNGNIILNIGGNKINIKNIDTITSINKKQFSRCLSNDINKKNWFNEE